MAGPKAKPTKDHSKIRSGLNKLKHKYDRQRIRTEKNKARKRAKHLAKNPNDTQGV